MVQCLCAPGVTRTVYNLPPNADVLATLDCITQLGIVSDYQPNQQRITLTTPETWPMIEDPTQKPLKLDAKNSGTTMRLLSGLLSGLQQSVTITGDDSLSQRPMQRIIEPLSQMGASIQSHQHPIKQTAVAPLTLTPSSTPLQPITYPMPVASAQVKSAILLAGLFAHGTTTVIETSATRDHTERMLQSLGIPVTTIPQQQGNAVSVTGPIQLCQQAPESVTVPGDISSALFLLCLAAITPGSDMTLNNIGINPGRTGALKVLQQWGANITITSELEGGGEPVATINLRYSPLSGNVTLTENDIPDLVDELPVLAMTAAFVQGTFSVSGAEELRHKECDRLNAIKTIFNALNLPIAMHPDGFTISGQTEPSATLPNKSDILTTEHDHRIGLCWHVLNHRLAPNTPWQLDYPDCINVSFPNFKTVLRQLTPVNPEPLL